MNFLHSEKVVIRWHLMTKILGCEIGLQIHRVWHCSGMYLHDIVRWLERPQLHHAFTPARHEDARVVYPSDKILEFFQHVVYSLLLSLSSIIGASQWANKIKIPMAISLQKLTKSLTKLSWISLAVQLDFV